MNFIRRIFPSSVPVFFLCAAMAACSSEKGSVEGGGATPDKPAKPQVRHYKNPVIGNSVPDPTVLRDDDGTFYLYGTEDMGFTPCFKSRNLVDWEFVSFCFDSDTRPSWNGEGGIWAPDINKINGKYVLYYTYALWGDAWTCGVGAAVADKPEGPFVDHGKLFRGVDVDVEGSIDQFYIEDGGRKYMFWGSFHGIYGIELSDDGLSIRPGAEKQKVSGNQTEGTYIYKHGGYYYLFGSNGTCCDGANSTYQVVYGRSESLFGPYVTKTGGRMLDGEYEVLMHGNNAFAGPGHNAEFSTDDHGDDWIIYHAYSKSAPDKGRQVMLDKVEWQDGWPRVAGTQPSAEAEVPYFE